MDLTSESFDSCGLTISQPRRGHRYGPESLALASFAHVREGDRVADLCSGCGIVALLLAARGTPARVVAVEIQEGLHQVALHNVRENGYGELVECVREDYRRFAERLPGAFDLVVANPPFFPKEGMRLPPDPQRSAARHELHGTIAELFAAARRLLVPGGRLAIVIDSRRQAEMERVAALRWELRRTEERGDVHFTVMEFLQRDGGDPVSVSLGGRR